MSKQYRQLLKNQPQVKVATVDHSATNKARFVAFAVAFMGFFFFFGSIWHALTGG
jgi:hypothetical protein